MKYFTLLLLSLLMAPTFFTGPIIPERVVVGATRTEALPFDLNDDQAEATHPLVGAALAAADFDADGMPDLLVANSTATGGHLLYTIIVLTI